MGYTCRIAAAILLLACAGRCAGQEIKELKADPSKAVTLSGDELKAFRADAEKQRIQRIAGDQQQVANDRSNERKATDPSQRQAYEDEIKGLKADIAQLKKSKGSYIPRISTEHKGAIGLLFIPDGGDYANLDTIVDGTTCRISYGTKLDFLISGFVTDDHVTDEHVRFEKPVIVVGTQTVDGGAKTVWELKPVLFADDPAPAHPGK